MLLVLAPLYLTAAWTSRFVVDRSFGPSYIWWDSALLLDATDEFLLLLVAGAALPFLFDVRRPIHFALAFGIAFGVVRWALSWHWVSPEAGFSAHLWMYCPYLASVLGAVAGATLTLLARRTSSRNVA
jgi:hypothetical protein